MFVDYENKILSVVEKAMQNHFLKNGNVKLFKLEAINVIERPFSTVCFSVARTSNGIQNLVIKTVSHHPINRSIIEQENQAVVEFNILSFLYPKFKDILNRSVPRPILAIPEIETFVMEFVDGFLLMEKFKYTRTFSSRSGFRDLRNYLFQCGRWLKNFHEFTGIRTGNLRTLHGIIERAQHRLRLIEESGSVRCPKNLKNRVTSFLDEQLDRLTETIILTSGRHGDFMPLNIIAAPGGITVIDFLGYQYEPMAVDLLKMLVFLEDEKKAVTSSANRVEELRKAFLYGYGDVPEFQEPLLAIIEAMQRIVSLWGNLSNPIRKFHHRIETNLCIKNHISWLMGENNRKLLLNPT